MDAVTLSRVQFAVATAFHFLFVPLTLGLSVLIAIMETRFAQTGDPVWRRMARFWGHIFLINFGIGVVTGITLEFQFGTNWSRYSEFVGDIFGSLLAIEATAAFFLESTLIGIWALGWKRMSPRTHAAIMWLITGASLLSAVWILVANAWMQHPVGYVLRNGRAELTDFAAVVFQKFAVLEILHTVLAAWILSGFFVMGVSAWRLLRRGREEVFVRSLKIGLVMALIASWGEAMEGHMHAADLAEKQPTKLAAMESHWQTQRRAPMYLFAWPDEAEGRNRIAFLPLPGMLSLLAYGDSNAVVKGLADFPPNDRPPVAITFISFRLMVALGVYFCIVTLVCLLKGNRLSESPRLLRLLVWSIPLPYVACLLGWIVAEVGRQPWIVYGLMRTADAASPVDAGSIAVSLTAFIVVYGLIGALGFGLMVKHIRTQQFSAETESLQGGQS